MSSRIQNKKNKKQSQKKHSKTKKNISARTRRYSNKNNTNKYKSMKGGGGALPFKNLIARIESKLDGVKLDDNVKAYYKERYESLTEDGKKKAFAIILEEIKNQVQQEKFRNASNGAAAAARVVHHEPDAMPVFTIITTGLSNWGSENNVIEFYGIIMESLILHTFFGKFAKIQIYHYDSNLTPEQQAFIKKTETDITEKYSIPLTSEIYKKNLDPRDRLLEEIPGLDTRNCFHLDFANLDEGKPMITDSFISIGGQPIKKLYFGYWEPTYPQKYEDIIKGIKLIEINPDKSITTFADKMRALGVSRPNLFYPIPECEGIPRQVITIPGIRTMYQWGGLDAIELYKSLWHSSPEGMKTYITDYQKWLAATASGTLETIKANATRTVFCEFCPVRQCLETKFKLNDFRPHSRLCGLCFRLTKDTIGEEMMKNIPHTSD